MNIIVSNEIKSVCPEFVGAAVEARVRNSQFCQELWNEIHILEDHFRQTLTTESLKDMPSIELIRRMLQGKELYQIDTLVDLVNLASIAFGYSIGGFDADKFVGNTLTLGIGREGEPYEGIGRGPLNIAGLPVYRDTQGGVGTPTSDNERTKMTLETTHLVVLINGYDGNRERVMENAQYLKQIIERFASGSDCSITLYP